MNFSSEDLFIFFWGLVVAHKDNTIRNIKQIIDVFFII